MNDPARYTLEFGDARASAPALVGGKGANLARLTAAGFNVPTGFTVTTDAYREFVAASGLQPAVLDHLATLDHADLDALERDTAALRAKFEAAPVPQEVDAPQGSKPFC